VDVHETTHQYVEDEDDPAKIWTILRDRFRPTTDVTLAQSLKHIVTLRMAYDGDMEAHIRDFTACKRRVEEHGVVFTDIVYRTFFLISMPTTYQITVTAIESQDGVTLEVAQNRFLEEWRKRKGQPKRPNDIGDALISFKIFQTFQVMFSRDLRASTSRSP
jgi:gag-polypeptide of LTR copia-type